MEKKNVFGLKKLFATIVLGITMMVGFLLVGCGNKYSAKFLKEEYIVSVGETIDITNGIYVENISLQDLSFYSSDTNLLRIENMDSLQDKNKTTFTAINSGSVTLYIYFKNEMLSTAKVTIKQSFSIPTNISVSETGVVTWNKVSVNVDGVLVDAKYKIQISQDGQNYNVVETDTNSYKLSLKGRYFIKIKAFGSELADDSLYSAEQEIYYQTVPTVTGLTLTNETTKHGEKGFLSWDYIEQADYYVVNINDNEQVVYGNNCELDLSNNQMYEIRVKGISENPDIMPGMEASLRINKLELTNLRVEDGKVVWDDLSNAQGYIVTYKSLSNEDISGTEFVFYNSYSLDSLPGDGYEIKVQAVGKTNVSRYSVYANSQIETLEGNIAKLENAELETSLSGDNLTMTVKTTQSKVKNFTLRVVEKATKRETIIDATIIDPAVNDVYSVSKTLELPIEGLYEIYLTSLEKDIDSIEVGSKQCLNIVNSDEELKHSVYKLPTLGTITHSYDENYNSLLSFLNPSYEHLFSTILNYNVRINGEFVENVEKKSTQKGYSLNIGEITKKYEKSENPNAYLITVEADMQVIPGNSSRITSTTEKLITSLILNLNTQGDSNKLEGKELTTDYFYSALNSTSYEYYILKTESNELATNFSNATKIIDNYGRISKPEPGYYSIYIKAYSNNKDLYLNSYEMDHFYVTKELDSPVLDFGKTNVKIEDPTEELDAGLLSGYYLDIETVSDGKTYEVYLNDVKLGEVKDEDLDGKVYYYFAKDKDFSSGSQTIKVIAKGSDSNIYHESENSISVVKMEKPTQAEANDQNLRFEIESGNLVFYKNAVSNQTELTANVEETAEGKIYDVDISSFYGSFNILVQATNVDRDNDTYYINSELASFAVQKIETPTSLKFDTDSIFFEYNEEKVDIDDEKVSIVALMVLQGGSLSSTAFEVELPYSILTKIGEKEYSFKLNDVIDQLNEEYPEFESAFAQRSSIKFTLFVETSYYDQVNKLYMFSSKNAISKENTNENYITISKLASQTLSFAEAEKKITWSDDADSTYEIEVEGRLTAQNASYADGEYSFDMKSYFDNIRDYEGKTVSVRIRKVASNYINSNWSNTIRLYFIKSVKALNINTNEDGKTFANFTYVDSNLDKNNINFTINNADDIEIKFDETKSSYQFELSSSVNTYYVNIRGYSLTDSSTNTTTYYVSSSSEPFVLRPISTTITPENLVFAESKMTWSQYSGEISPNYQIYFDKDGDRFAKILVEGTALALDNATLLGLSAGTYDVSVYAVNKDFTVYGGESKYYGGTIIAEGSTNKLNNVTNVKVEIDETKTKVNEEINLNHKLTWNWSGDYVEGAKVYFEIYLHNMEFLARIDYVEGQTAYEYSIAKSEFGDLNNKISIIVKDDKDVSSMFINKYMYRFIAPTISITDEKVLSINNNLSAAQEATNGYILKITVGETIFEQVVNQNTIDLTEILKDYDGAYTIEVLTKAISNVAISPINISTITGTLLEKAEIEKTSEKLLISSEDDGVRYYLTILKDNEVLLENYVVENGEYVFADDFAEGDYIFNVVAKKEGCLSSYISSYATTIKRVGEIDSFTQTRTAPTSTTLDTKYTFTWNDVADNYKFVIYSEVMQALVEENLSTNTYSFDASLFGSFSGAGKYYIGVRAISNDTTEINGTEAIVELRVKAQAGAVQVTSEGLLRFEGSGNYILFAKDQNKNKTIELTQETAKAISGGKYAYELYLEEVTGEITVDIISVATDVNVQTNAKPFLIDSVKLSTTVEKMQEVRNIEIDSESGKIYITTAEDYGTNLTFFFKSENALYGYVPAAQSGNIYSEDFIKIFDKLNIQKEGENTVEVYIVKSGKLRSEVYSFTFEFTQSVTGDYTQNTGIDFLHDYLIIHKKDNKEIKNIFVKITKGSTTTSIYEAETYRGYWNQSSDKEYFSKVADTAALSSEEVYAIKVNDLLTDSGDYIIDVSYSYVEDEVYGINNWSGALDYQKLPKTNDLVASNGKLYWSMSTSSLSASVTGYYIIFEEENGDYQYIYVPSSEIKEVSTNGILGYNKSFKVSVVTVNKDHPNKISSSKVYFRNGSAEIYNVIKSNEMAKAIEIEDGVLSMTLDRDGSDESYGTLSTFTLSEGQLLSKTIEDGKIYMPYGLGRKHANDVKEGTGTFTAIEYNDQIMYVRTSFINATTYAIKTEARVYESYNVALEDVLEKGSTVTRYDTTAKCLTALSQTTFTYPFVFNLESLTKGLNKFELNFKNVESQVDNVIVVDALNILSKTTYATVIRNLVTKTGTNTEGYKIVSELNSMLKGNTCFTGIASSELLFDEAGEPGSGNKTGENIQAGIYDIYVSQIGFGFTSEGVPTYVLSSPKVKASESVEVCASVATKTDLKPNADGYTNTYFLKFAPSISEGNILTDYVLRIDYIAANEEKQILIYDIKYEEIDGVFVWNLYVDGEAIVLNTEVEGLTNYVLIPLNGENGLDGLLNLLKKITYNVNIYSIGTDLRLSSKTETIEIGYLGFDSSINLTSKGFAWSSYDTYSTKVVYKRTMDLDVKYEEFEPKNEKQYFLPVDSGMYEYIMFFTSGNVDKFRALVDSEIYRIENVYKLYAPIIKTNEYGLFSIQNNPDNIAAYTDHTFKITNNKSVTYGLNHPDEDELCEITSLNVYKAGTHEDNPNAYKETEDEASTYYFVAKGDDVDSFTISDFNNGQFKLMEYEANELFLTSERTEKKAIMLKNPASIEINEEGNITWAEVSQSVTRVLSAIYEEDFVVAYKVEVEYYYETSAGLTKDAKIDTFYTKQNVLPSTYIEGSDESNEYIYRVIVSAFVCRDSDNLNNILTSIGELGRTEMLYANSEYYVLTNKGFSQDFTRLNDVQNVSLVEGKITWESQYRDTNRYVFVVRYHSAAADAILDGTYEFDEDLGKFVFTMDESEENKVLIEKTNYTISVYVYAKNKNENKLESFRALSSPVQINPYIRDNQFKMTSKVENGVNIDKYDFMQYFLDNLSTNYTKIIQVNFKQYKSNGTLNDEGSFNLFYDSSAFAGTYFEIESTNSKYNSEENQYKIYLPDGYKLELRLVVITDFDNYKAYLNSYSYDITLERQSWGEKDKIEFNDLTQTFSWTYGKEMVYYLNSDAQTFTGASNKTPSVIVGILTAGTELTFRPGDTYKENNGYVRIWVDIDSDKNVDSGETVYVLAEKVSSRISDEKTGDIYFNVAISYMTSTEDAQKITEVVDERLFTNVTNRFFIPEVIGAKIIKVKVQAKEGKNNVYSSWIEFDEIKDFNLFASGDGTETNPYIIETEEQFRNMNIFESKPSYLTTYELTTTVTNKNKATGAVISGGIPVVQPTQTQSDKYFFKLVKDITLTQNDDFVIGNDFDSILDCDGHTITYIAQGGKEVNLNGRVLNGEGFETKTFNQASAIFRKLSVNAVVKNLKLNVQYTYYPLKNGQATVSTTTLMASLVIENSGLIENVELVGFDFKNEEVFASTFVVGGLVGINTGIVNNSKISTNIEIISTYAAEQLVYCGGVVAFNVGLNSVVSNCVTNANLFNIKLTNSANGVAQFGGIVLSNFNGTIKLCGNNTSVNVTCPNGTANASGIVVYSESGQIIDSFNNGEITGTNENDIAGIAVFCSSKIGNVCSFGKTNNQTDSVNTIAKIFNGEVISACYAQNALTSNVPTTQIDRSSTLSTSDANISIVVTVQSGIYQVNFVTVN